jgi:type III secretion system YscD/HrpQ family protein
MTAYLIAEEGFLSGLTIPLAEGERWVLGRDPDVAGVVLEDPTVSREHLLCRLTSEGYVVENLSTVNPATCNELPITEPIRLNEGDLIHIGGTLFRFTQHAPSHLKQEEEEVESSFEDPELSSYTLPTVENRWMIKVISGPNVGAEFTLQPDQVYIIGKDPNISDIIFQDLSVSRQHARLSALPDGRVTIEDLGSRNGIILNNELLTEKRFLSSQDLIALGTTSFLIIDRLDTRDTIFAPPALIPAIPEISQPASEELSGSPSPPPRDWKELIISRKQLLLGGAFASLLLIALISIFGLFSSTPVIVAEKNYTGQIKEALSSYPSVQFSWSGDGSGKLFLIGHVLTDVDHQELLYAINNLNFISSIEDTIVIDEFVWQNMNGLLSTNPEWVGVSIHSPIPGRFVLRGYLQTIEQAERLQDYMNRQFPYLDRLDNQVVVGSTLNTQIQGILSTHGYSGVSFQLSNGELMLSGNVPDSATADLQRIIDGFKTIRGIRAVKNYIVFSTEIASRTDLSQKYQVTGSSSKDGKSFSVVINGRILGRGDLLDGMVITEVEPSAVFLEKDGAKFKISYNL